MAVFESVVSEAVLSFSSLNACSIVCWEVSERRVFHGKREHTFLHTGCIYLVFGNIKMYSRVLERSIG